MRNIDERSLERDNLLIQKVETIEALGERLMKVVDLFRQGANIKALSAVEIENILLLPENLDSSKREKIIRSIQSLLKTAAEYQKIILDL